MSFSCLYKHLSVHMCTFTHREREAGKGGNEGRRDEGRERGRDEGKEGGREGNF